MTGTGVGSGEGVVWLCEVVTVSTGDGCLVVLICHIGDEDSVPDVRIHPRHIQGEGRAPGEEDGAIAILNTHITHWSQQTWEVQVVMCVCHTCISLAYLESSEWHSHSL